MNKRKSTMFALSLGVGFLLVLSQVDGQSLAEAMSPDRTGMLEGAAGHHAGGVVELTGRQLTLSQLKVDRVPDGRVYLTVGADYEYGIELGKLRQFSGTVRYDVPSDVNPDQFDSVLIWCEKFNVEIGFANLKPNPQ